MTFDIDSRGFSPTSVMALDRAAGHDHATVPTSRPLRVLFMVDYARTVGGAERFVTGLAAHMPRDRVEPWVCSTRHGEESAVQLLHEAGVAHIGLGRTAKWQLHRFIPLARILRRHQFDVIHANMFGSNFWGTLLGRLSGVPVVIAHEHTWSYANDPVRLRLDRHVIGALATTFVAVSAADRDRMINLERIPAEKVVLMPVPHIPHPQTARSDIRAELGLNSDTPLIAVAAVLRPQKALDVMVDAHALLLERVPTAHLVMAGHGPCLQRLEQQIKSLGLGDSVHLLGNRDDVDAILHAADVGAISSNFEGMPQFALECIAARTPIVATAVGGLPEIVENDRTGLLVPPQDPPALAAALERVLTDGAFANRLAEAAAARSSDFRIETVADRFATLYADLLAKTREAPFSR